jgi:chromate transporter
LFFRAGNTTFGGGDPTMAVLLNELVHRRRWLTREDYALIFALARLTPGTNLLAFCAGAAWRLLGWRAAVATVAVVTLPAAAIVVLLTEAFAQWEGNRVAMAAINGTLAAAVGMMIGGAWMLLRPQLAAPRRLRAVVVGGLAIGLSLGLGWSPVPVLLLAAAAGAVWRR